MSGGRGISFSLGGGAKGGRAGGPGGGAKPLLAFGISGGRGGTSAKRPEAPAAAIFETVQDSDDEEDDKHKPQDKRRRVSGAPSPSAASSAGIQAPSDPEVRKVAEKLASFVAKNGDSFENVTKERNPGDTPFRFLFDKSSNDYKWYEMKKREVRDQLNPPKSAPTSTRPPSNTPASGEDAVNTIRGSHATEEARRAKMAQKQGDSLAAMNAYMKLAAKHEEKRGPVQDTTAMPPPEVLLSDTGREKTFAVYKEDGQRGHHMGDYIPPEEMDAFLAKQGDPSAQARVAAKELASRIGADNKGHQMMQKMGWSEGAGLGASQVGMATPIGAGEVKQDNLGIGAANTHEVTGGDDIYEAYKKRMMLGYKHRPNPLGNPRKQYY